MSKAMNKMNHIHSLCVCRLFTRIISKAGREKENQQLAAEINDGWFLNKG